MTPIGLRLGIYANQDVFSFPDQANLVRAYSIDRRLVRGYGGSAFRVRRSSDNAEQDIGFVDNVIDESSLTSFVGANDGLVVTVYDQKAVNDLTQVTAGDQPEIIVSGVLNKDAANRIYFDTTSGPTKFVQGSTGSIVQPGAWFLVGHRQGTGAGAVIIHRDGAAGEFWALTASVNYQVVAGAGLVGPVVDTTQHLFTFLVDGVSSDFLIDSSSVDSGDAGAEPFSGITLGASISGSGPHTFVYEFLVYDADKSTQRQSIEDNISDFYSINALPDQTDLARAYSLDRKLVSGYSGDSFRVRRSSDNAEQDIGFIGNFVDQDAITSFVGANDGFVVTAYDQTAAAVDLSQSTAGDQPKMVSSGTLNKDAAGRIYADTEGTRELENTTGSLSQPGAVFAVAHRQSTSGTVEVLYDRAAGGATTFWRITTETDYRASAATATFLTGPATDTTQHLFTFLVDGVNSEFYMDGSLEDSGDAGANTNAGIVWGANVGGALGVDAFLYELIYYDADKSGTRASIETNINNFYSIF